MGQLNENRGNQTSLNPKNTLHILSTNHRASKRELSDFNQAPQMKLQSVSTKNQSCEQLEQKLVNQTSMSKDVSMSNLNTVKNKGSRITKKAHQNYINSQKQFYRIVSKSVISQNKSPEKPSK